MNLSPQQQQAFDKILAWHKTDEKRFVLAGYAGAGKTTLAKKIADEIPYTVFCAYTGKASQVLRDKGCKDASTIHGFLYKKIDSDKGPPRFFYEPNDDWMRARLIIADEYSMLNAELIADMERAGKKILYLGDPFQITPVKGTCPLHPDFFIEEIHRQALDSPIIRFSKMIREGAQIPFGDHGDFKYLRQKDTCPTHYTDADQIIVGRNETKDSWNKKFRKINNFISDMPVIGDKMICLKNNHDIGLYNGLIGTAKNNCKADRDIYDLDFAKFKKLEVWKGDITGLSARYDDLHGYLKSLERFDFAYVITAHKSQGSEFDKVLVYHQPVGTGIARKKWLYTGVTRAKKQCILVEPA